MLVKIIKKMETKIKIMHKINNRSIINNNNNK